MAELHPDALWQVVVSILRDDLAGIGFYDDELNWLIRAGIVVVAPISGPVLTDLGRAIVLRLLVTYSHA